MFIWYVDLLMRQSEHSSSDLWIPKLVLCGSLRARLCDFCVLLVSCRVLCVGTRWSSYDEITLMAIECVSWPIE